jgi:thermospermine synthase
VALAAARGSQQYFDFAKAVLCLQDFYQNVVLQKLNPGGIFITQSGPAGFLSCTEVFTCINATLRSVFPHVLPYTQHMPVFCDVWGWNMALTDPSQAKLTSEDMDARLAERVEGEMGFLDGHTFKGLCHINKTVRR